MISLLILIFTYLPNFLVHLIVILGSLGVSITFLPILSNILTLIPTISKENLRIISIIILSLGIFLEGGLAVNSEYLERAKEWNHKVEIAENKAENTSKQIEYVFQDRIQKVKETQVIVRDKIRDVSVNIDDKCKLTSETIDILNTAAKGK